MNANAALLDRIIRMGEVIARDGISAAGMDVLLLAHDARDHGVDEVVVTVMIDENAPTVARERAFAKVASALIAFGAQPSPVTIEPGPALSFRVAATN